MNRQMLEVKTINLLQEIRRTERRVSTIKCLGVMVALFSVTLANVTLGPQAPTLFGAFPLGPTTTRMLILLAAFLTPIFAASLITEFLWHLKTDDRWLAELAKFSPICDEVAFLRLTLQLQRNGYLTARDLQRWSRNESIAARRHVFPATEPIAAPLTPGAAALLIRATAMARARNETSSTGDNQSPR